MTDDEIRKSAMHAYCVTLGTIEAAVEAVYRAGMEAGRAEAQQAWVPLTNEDRMRALESLPDMLEGFMKEWGLLHFARAVEAICREKNAPTKGE